METLFPFTFTVNVLEYIIVMLGAFLVGVSFGIVLTMFKIANGHWKIYTKQELDDENDR